MPEQDKNQPQSAPELPTELAAQHGIDHRGKDETPEVTPEPVLDTSSDVLDSPETTEAIEEITRDDDEVVLEVETAPEEEPAEPTKKRGRIREFFRRWWGNPVARWCTIIGLIVLVIASGLWPTSRYAVLNTVGVRASTTLKVIDSETRLPLKNVTVSASGVTTKTNGDGQATLRRVKLGEQDIRIERAAFAPVSLERTLGWGSNPLPDVLLEATGLQLRFTALDYLSGKPVTSAQASVGDAVAIADDKGQIVLTAADPEADTVTVELTGQGYKTEQVVVAVASIEASREIKLVPAQSLVYISKQSGKYDVLKTDIRGEKPELLLAGTGEERRDSLRLAASPDGATAALVSTRTTQRDADRYPMSTLTLIQSADGANRAIDLAQRIEPIAWQGNTLVYHVVYASASSANSQRSKIIAFDTSSSARKVLATADYFNGAQVVGDTLYYATTQTDPALPSHFTKISISGSSKATLLDKPVWSMLRTSPTEMSLETPDGWYTYLIGDTAARRGTAVDYANARAYTDTPDGKLTAWVDNRDGKGVIVLTDAASGAERVVASASGLQQPLRWLGAGVLTYRVVTTDETADYAVSINGGEPRKVVDVTDVDGFAFGQ
jgi:hypothetical protein